ncbi:hypothetical protein [Polaribacter marinaquae]|uniref:DNA-binding protein n=1 Tax=Polaribacter marinaquae TaxID=1642819 RepID=A0ABZ2TUS9_9FLAO
MIEQTPKNTFNDAIILVEYFRENALRLYNKLSSINPLDNFSDNKQKLFKELGMELKKSDQAELFKKHGISGGSLAGFLNKKDLFKRVDSIGNYQEKFK